MKDEYGFLDYHAELEKMRSNLRKNRSGVRLPACPSWVGYNDQLSFIYKNSDYTLKYGDVYYARIVQANKLLFRNIFILDRSTDSNNPANIIYSTTRFINDNPEVLSEIAHDLFSYKNNYSTVVPERYLEIVASIRNELDRKSVRFLADGFDDLDEPQVVNFLATLVFRPFLPKRRLIGSVIPVIACDSYWNTPIILPKEYWTENFTNAWMTGEI